MRLLLLLSLIRRIVSLMGLVINYYERRKAKSLLVFHFGAVTEQTSPKPVSSSHPQSPSTVLPGNLMSLTVTDTQQFTLSLTATDKRGNPVTGTSLGTVVWAVDAPAVLTVTPSADTASAVVMAAGPLGNAVVSVKATLPDGTAASGSFGVTVISGSPVNIVITPSSVTEQP